MMEYLMEWKESKRYFSNIGLLFTDEVCDYYEQLRCDWEKSLPVYSLFQLKNIMGIKSRKNSSKETIDKEEVKSFVNMEDLIQRYAKNVKVRGDRLIALCPFHQEYTPSFSVDTKKKLFHCFSCSISGDCFTLVMKLESCSFVEALKLLKEWYS